VEAVDINGSGSWAGAVAGFNGGDITGVYSTGAVTSDGWHIGGLVGANYGGSMTNCYSTASVDGNEYVGGLVGRHQYHDITNCYSTGSVSGNANVGGLVGYSGDTIPTSFWDIETSGQTESDGGIGKTTAEMQTAATFLDAGWDFEGETENGTDDIWWIDEGLDYPHLWWEGPGF
jgi:hypothetical protein